MDRVFIGLGSNLGDARSRVNEAISCLDHVEGITVVQPASLYGSKPYGPITQDNFVNTVVEIRTELEPSDLLSCIKQLEIELGRTEGARWGPREIDLDILLYGDRQSKGPDLNLPHPGIAERAFVLMPLAELYPDFVLPSGKAVQQACSEIQTGLVWRLEESATSCL